MQILRKNVPGLIALSALACAGTLGCNGSSGIMASRYVKAVDVAAGASTTIAVSALESAELSGTTLEIPPGALGAAARVTLELQRADLGPIDDSAGAGPVAVWGPEGTTFTGGATLRLPFRPTQAQAGDEPVVVVADAQGALQLLEGAAVTADAAAGWIKVVIHGAGRYQPGMRRHRPGMDAGVCQACLVISPTAHEFGDATVGTASGPAVFTVANSGVAMAGAITVTLDNNVFAVVANGCGTLAPGKTCDISVSFRPTAPGRQQGALKVTAGGAGSALATLAGNGVAGPSDGCAGGCLVITPTIFDFGEVALGASSRPMPFVVANRAQVPVTTTIKSDPAAFMVASTDCNVLAPGATCVVKVIFKPTTAGGRTGVLKATGAPGGSVIATLAGTGVGTEPTPDAGAADVGPCAGDCLAVAPTTADFGSVRVGDKSAEILFVIANPSGGLTAAYSIGIEGTDAASFGVVSNGCGPVTPGATCAVSVTFTPTAAGARSARLRVSDGSGASVFAALSGLAVP
jgi:hypothetical protein